jgi:hypothetical protein
MAITTYDGFIASAKQYISLMKTASRTSIAATWFSVFDLAGNPGAGTLAGSSTAAGVVPTDATAGTPTINAFGGGATGYLAQVDFGSTVACRIKLFDMLFKAGAYAFNANTTLAAQPSYSSRVPGGTDFTDTQIWIEAVTAFTGNLSIAVTYTNQSGTAARTTGTVATGVAPTVGRMIQLPLQAGDTGVQKIESVVGTVATVGTFNVLVLRPLWSGRVKVANDGDVHDLSKTGMPAVFADSAIVMAISADSTTTGIPELEFVIANG